MAERKKQSKKRTPRKRKPAKPKKPTDAELKPHKIVGQLIGARYDEHGEMVAEELMGEVAIYSANFSKVRQIVDKALKEAREAEQLQREALAERAN